MEPNAPLSGGAVCKISIFRIIAVAITGRYIGRLRLLLSGRVPPILVVLSVSPALSLATPIVFCLLDFRVGLQVQNCDWLLCRTAQGMDVAGLS